MASKRHNPDEIVTKLQQAEVARGQGMAMADAVRQIGVSELTYYRWRKQYGGMSRDQLRQLKELQKESEQIRKAVADLTLDKLILTSLFGAHGSTPCFEFLRRLGGLVLRSSCFFSPRSAPSLPHDGIRGSGRSHLSRAISHAVARVSTVSPAPVVPAGTSSIPEELGIWLVASLMRQAAWAADQRKSAPSRHMR